MRDRGREEVITVYIKEEILVTLKRSIGEDALDANLHRTIKGGSGCDTRRRSRRYCKST
jgi:hypothetical protein